MSSVTLGTTVSLKHSRYKTQMYSESFFIRLYSPVNRCETSNNIGLFLNITAAALEVFFCSDRSQLTFVKKNNSVSPSSL